MSANITGIGAGLAAGAAVGLAKAAVENAQRAQIARENREMDRLQTIAETGKLTLFASLHQMGLAAEEMAKLQSDETTSWEVAENLLNALLIEQRHSERLENQILELTQGGAVKPQAQAEMDKTVAKLNQRIALLEGDNQALRSHNDALLKYAEENKAKWADAASKVDDVFASHAQKIQKFKDEIQGLHSQIRGCANALKDARRHARFLQKDNIRLRQALEQKLEQPQFKKITETDWDELIGGPSMSDESENPSSYEDSEPNANLNKT